MKNRKSCILCQEAKVFPFTVDGYGFDKCLPCAIVHVERLRTEFMTMLVSDEQISAFCEYEKAMDDRLAMQVAAIGQSFELT